MLTVDGKHLLLFAAIIVLAALVVAQTTHSPVPQVQTVSASNGRYQIVMHPQFRGDKFLLDTQTGKVWQFVQYTDLQGDPEVWQVQDRVDNGQELQNWWHRQTPKAKPQQVP